jgi:peptidylprolyl isomerase
MLGGERIGLMRILTTLALMLLAAAPLFAQTPPPQQSVATPPPDVGAPPANAAKTASGLASRVIKAGTGKTHPGKTDLVTVHYTGWKTDGAMFDSSVLRGKPAAFPLDRVIAGWTEGVQLMVEGEKRRFWIPEALAYKGQREPKGMLVFDVELISFMPSPTDAPRT